MAHSSTCLDASRMCLFTGIYGINRASEWLWLETEEAPQNGQNVHGFQVRTPICHCTCFTRLPCLLGRKAWKSSGLVFQYSAIGDTISCDALYFQGPLNGGLSNGGFPDLDVFVLFCPFSGLSRFFIVSFLFCPFWDFPDFSEIFPICPGMVWGFSRFALFLFLGLSTAPTRNSPESGPFPKKKFGNPPRFGNPPGLASLNYCTIGFRGNLFCDAPLVKPVFGLRWAIF